jgi:hypothetical protein
MGFQKTTSEPLGAGCSPNTGHVIRKHKVNTIGCVGSSCRPGALLEISYFTGELQCNILQHYSGSGEDD